MNVRTLSAHILHQVLVESKPLDPAIRAVELKLTHPKDRSLLRHLCFGVVRYHASLNALALQLLGKKPKDAYIGLLLELGLFQIKFMRVPIHAAVFSTVNACKVLKLNSATKLLNALLRRYVREQAEWDQVLTHFEQRTFEHPKWIRKQLQRDWGAEQSEAIMVGNNQRAPMVLRNNPLSQSTDDYLQQLSECGIKAQQGVLPESIVLAGTLAQNQLPGWQTGACSVQSLSAQVAVHLLNLQPDERVMDVCAAPGNKSLQILQSHPSVRPEGMDINEKRVAQLEQLLSRFQLSMPVVVADASDSSAWPGAQYDVVLLDAPCTASGSIRRNPDIKWLRSSADIARCVALQNALLITAWSKLKVGGRLLYATCSVFKQENDGQIANWLMQTPDAEIMPITIGDHVSGSLGMQIFPEGIWDGFYYALIRKCQ